MGAPAEAKARFLSWAAATKLFYSCIVREGREGETGETCHQAWMLVWKSQGIMTSPASNDMSSYLI